MILWGAAVAGRNEGMMTAIFRAEDERVAGRADYWRHVVCDTFVPFDMRMDARPDFRGRLRANDLGAVRVVELSAPGTEVFRGPKLIRRSDPDLCKIDVRTHGRVIVAQDGREAVLGRADFTFIDLSRPGHWACPGDRHGMVAVVFPRSLLPLTAKETADLTAVRFSGRQGTGALISSLIRKLARHLDELDPTDGFRLSTALMDLLTVSMAGRLGRDEAIPPQARQRALLTRIDAYIEERLGDPALSPATIAAAHHISTRYLHKLFEAEERTVASWIRRRRLDRAQQDLLDLRFQQPVSAVGARWGFASASQFNRVFRARFGVPPGEYRLAHSHPTELLG